MAEQNNTNQQNKNSNKGPNPLNVMGGLAAVLSAVVGTVSAVGSLLGSIAGGNKK